MTRKLELATPAERAAHRKKLVEREEFEKHENDRIVQRVLATVSGLAEQDFDVVVIPSGYAGTSKLPDERIRLYAEHLRKMISEAHESPDESSTRNHREKRLLAEEVEALFAAEPGLRDISSRMCGMCRGGCCAAGGTNAYITSATIQREKKRQPGLSDEDLVQQYLSRLPSQTITNGCVNLTTSGCVLPTEMRSEICNGFHCDGLSAWLDRPREERANAVLAIKRSGTYWERNDLSKSHQVVEVALVKAESVQPLPTNVKALHENS